MELKKGLIVWAFAVVMAVAVVGTLMKNLGVCSFNLLVGKGKDKRKEDKQ